MINTLATTDDIINATRTWVDKAVIGLNLCPFAKAVQVKNQLRYVVSDANDLDALLADLRDELQALTKVDPTQIDTSLLIHPLILSNFLDFNDFLELADAILDELGLTGEIQIASFHPHYQFAGTGPEDIENYTNRSPYPTLHLLRESSIERAVATFPDASDIYSRNMDTLHRLGHAGWQQLGLCALPIDE
jgi:hypothetical protein